MARNVSRDLIAEIERHGVREHHIEYGAKHPRLVFPWQGRQLSVVFSGTCSDTARGTKNTVSYLRRAMGVKRLPDRKRAA